MFNKRRFLLVNKLNLVIILFIVVVYYCPVTLSKYESNSSGGAVSSIAYYVVGTDYQTDSIHLTSLVPSDEPYTYTFTVSNFDSNNHLAETDLFYDLSIVTTTNLPLEYELYMSNDGSVGNTNIITLDNTELDESGTYFRTLSTERVYLSHEEAVTYTYTLSILFNSVYNSSRYQDIIEGIRIIIDSKQVLDSDAIS